MSTFAKDSTDNLTAYSPQDKPWDVHKFQADVVGDFYAQSAYSAYKARISACGELLTFRWAKGATMEETRLKLFKARFCHLRYCPVCQWRRSLLWIARFYRALPGIQAQYPTGRWLFLTLTVRNCELSNLRPTLKAMNVGWKRLIQCVNWPALGFVRSAEITRSREGLAHPHFHALLLVRSSYFTKGYIPQARWTELWQDCMRLDYQPLVDVRAVKKGNVEAVVPEVLKYAVKPQDMMVSADWLEMLTTQVYKLRFLATGGALKDAIAEAGETDEDLVTLGELVDSEAMGEVLRFSWNRPTQRYCRKRR